MCQALCPGSGSDSSHMGCWGSWGGKGRGASRQVPACVDGPGFLGRLSQARRRSPHPPQPFSDATSSISRTPWSRGENPPQTGFWGLGEASPFWGFPTIKGGHCLDPGSSLAVAFWVTLPWWGGSIPPTSLHPRVVMRGMWPAGPLPWHLGLQGSPVVRALPSRPHSQPSQSSSPRAQRWRGRTQAPPWASARPWAGGPPLLEPRAGPLLGFSAEAAVFTLPRPSFYSLKSVFGRREPPRAHALTHHLMRQTTRAPGPAADAAPSALSQARRPWHSINSELIS